MPFIYLLVSSLLVSLSRRERRHRARKSFSLRQSLALIYRWAVVPVIALVALNVLTGMTPTERKILLAASNFINPPTFTSLSSPGFTTYAIPSWAQSLDIWILGSAGGGGSGARRATGGIRTGGASGGSGAFNRETVAASLFGGPGATIQVAVGAGGLGGAMITADTTNGNTGGQGQACGIGTVIFYNQTSVLTGLNSIAFGAGIYVMTGASGVVTTSTTPTVAGSWATQTSNAGGNQLNAVIFGNGIFVAVGVGGTIVTSPDGVTWTARTSGTTNQLNDILWDGTNFVAVGNAGTILYSTDGTTLVEKRLFECGQSCGRSKQWHIAIYRGGFDGQRSFGDLSERDMDSRADYAIFGIWPAGHRPCQRDVGRDRRGRVHLYVARWRDVDDPGLLLGTAFALFSRDGQ